jgi:hypothetical protein
MASRLDVIVPEGTSSLLVGSRFITLSIAPEISAMTPRTIQPMMPPEAWDPTADRAQMLAQWYEHYLRREPDAQGFRNWMAQLNTTTPEVALASILGMRRILPPMGRDGCQLRGRALCRHPRPPGRPR